MQRGPYQIDWHQLKAEYLSNQISLTALRDKHQIAKTNFRKHTRGWHEQKAALQKKAIHNVEAKLVGYYERYVEETRRVLSLMNQHLLRSLELGQEITEDGRVTVVRPRDPQTLQELAKTLSENLKSTRLIEGKSTENKALAVQGDLNSALVTVLEYINQGTPQ